MTDRGKWYPDMPPVRVGESAIGYEDRLIADGVFDHERSPHCLAGLHLDCDNLRGTECECPHHHEVSIPAPAIDGRIIRWFSEIAKLPYATASRVLAHTQEAIRMGEATTFAGMQVILGEVYDSPIGENFAINACAALDYTEINGALHKA